MKAYQLVNKEMKDEGGALYLIGGRPAMGKTAFMINIVSRNRFMRYARKSMQ